MDIKFTPKEKMKWCNFQRRLASWLVSLAYKIYPDSPEVRTFWAKCMVDHMIYGKVITKVEPPEFFKQEETTNDSTTD